MEYALLTAGVIMVLVLICVFEFLEDLYAIFTRRS